MINITGFNNVDGNLRLINGGSTLGVTFAGSSDLNTLTAAPLNGGVDVVDQVGLALEKWVPLNVGTAGTVAALTILGSNNNDTFDVTPNANIPIFLDGGAAPIGVTPGNLINLAAGASSVTFTPGPTGDSGGFVVGADQPVSFVHIQDAL